VSDKPVNSTFHKVFGQFPVTRFSPDIDISLILTEIPDIFMTAVKLPDISLFFRQVVTLCSVKTNVVAKRSVGFYAPRFNEIPAS